ncbi:hypothetical protein OIV83_002375 [Microbotryomycetes sp. JL201]|nr:hypothetical protein OIV83_002375 [Microbotryomycetes sp. JL201]
MSPREKGSWSRVSDIEEEMFRRSNQSLSGSTIGDSTDALSTQPSPHYVSSMPALSNVGPINPTHRQHIIDDLLHAKNLEHRVGNFLEQLAGREKRDTLIKPIRLHFVWRWGHKDTGIMPIVSVAAIVSCMGVWTTDGPLSYDDTTNGLFNVSRERLQLPVSRQTVRISTDEQRWQTCDVDEWVPVAWHQTFKTETTEWGEATSWKLNHGQDFPEGLPVIFVFDKARQRSIRRRFDAYERFGEGISRARLEPGVRLSPMTSPFVLAPQDPSPNQSPPSVWTTSPIRPKDSLWILSRYIGEFLLTIGGIHWVPGGWEILDNFNGQLDKMSMGESHPVRGDRQVADGLKRKVDEHKVITVVNARICFAGLDTNQLQRVWRHLPELPKIGAWMDVMHTMPPSSVLERIGVVGHNRSNARWTLVRRELADDKSRAGWRNVVATTWIVEDFPIFGGMTIRFI